MSQSKYVWFLWLLLIIGVACADDAEYADALDLNADSGDVIDLDDANDDADVTNGDSDFIDDDLADAEVDSDNTDADSGDIDADLADAAAAFNAYVAETVSEDNIVGAAVAVFTSDDVLFMDGFGYRDLEAELPVDDATLFHIGSTNKSFTALLIATLVDDGLLTWDTPAVEIYPAFELSEADATEEVTMRHLLSMRSGIPDWAEDDFDIDEASADDVIPYVADTDLLGLPGDEFSYSNISSSISGYLGVIAVTGSPNDLYDGYATMITERILRPIGMENAVVHVSDALENPNYGKSYILRRGNPTEADPEDYDGDPLAPSGTIKASVAEMMLYVQMQLNEGVAPNGTEIVSAENVTETWKPYLENYGMGWESVTIDGISVISHEGSYDNYLSIIGFSPEQDLGFVILANTADAADALISDSPAMIIELFAE